MSTERGVTQELCCSNQDQQMLVLSSPATAVVALQTPTPNWYFLPSFCPIQKYLPDIRKAMGQDEVGVG